MATFAGTWSEPFIDQRGNATPTVTVTVYEDDGTTPATLWADRTKTVGVANPLPTGVATGEPGLDDEANALFFADPGEYVMAVEYNGTEVYRSPVAVPIDPEEVGAVSEPGLAAHLIDPTGAHAASAVSFLPAGSIAATDVQAAIEEVVAEAGAGDAASVTFTPAGTISATDVQAAIEEVASEAGSGVASSISFTPAGTIASTNVQDAIAEVATDATAGLQAHLLDATAAHTASAIGFDPAGTVAATDVQAAVEEVSGDVTTETAARTAGDALLIPLAQKGAANGVAPLGADTKVPSAYLPSLSGTEVFVVNSEAAMLALAAVEGDHAIRTDTDQTFILAEEPASVLANWVELSTSAGVTSVDGLTGNVDLSTSYAPFSETASRIAGDAAVQANLDAHIGDTVDAHDASAVSFTPAGTLGSNNVQGALEETSGDVTTVSDALAAHLADTADAHDASAVSFSPAGTISATDVQGALEEVDDEAAPNAANLTAHLSDTSDAHDASAISFAPGGTVSATDVQAAILEVASEPVPIVVSDTSTVDFTGDGTVATPLSAVVPDGSLALTKLANINTDRLVGRDTAGSGAPEQITVSGGVEFTNSGGIQRSAITGDITIAAGSATAAITAGVIVTADLADDQVTFAKMQNVTTQRILGRQTASTGDIEQLTVSGGLEFTTGGIQRSAVTGDVTISAGATAATIPNDTVTYAKMQNVSATDRLLGRDTAGAGDIEEIAPAAARVMLDVPSNAEAVLDSIADAKGDLIVGTANDTVARQAVGANDTVLMAASGQTTGVKWATPAEVRTAIGIPSTFAANVGNGSSTAITVTHGLGTRDVNVEVYRNSTPWDTVAVYPTRPSTDTVTLTFDVAPATNEYRVVVRA